MGWSGRAPARPASEAGMGHRRQGARHVLQAQYCDCHRDRHRYRQEFVPHCGPRPARCDRAASEVVTWPGRSEVRQPTAMPDRHGGLCRRTSSQSQAAVARTRRPADAGEVCAPLFEGAEERLPRRGGDCRGSPTPDHEVRRDQDRRPARPASAAPRARAIGWPAHWHHQSDPRLPAGAWHRGAARAAFPASRVARHPGDAHRCALAPHVAHRRGLAGDWRRLDERIEGLTEEIEAVARKDAACERLMSVPGIGPIISSAMVAAIGTGDVFSKGRDFAAWLGLVPKQISTGDRTILGKISRRGNRYLRVLFVQAAWVVLIKPKSWERHGLKSWIEAAKKRLHRNVLAIALANKLARIAWSVLAHGRDFEARKIDEAAAQPA